MEFTPEPEPDAPMTEGEDETVSVHGLEFPLLRDFLKATNGVLIVRTGLADGSRCRAGIEVHQDSHTADWEVRAFLMAALAMYVESDEE